MEGRLETKIKNEKAANNLLKQLPQYVEEYYYSALINKEARTALEYIKRIKKFLTYCNENIENFNIFKITEIEISKYLKSIETKETNNGVIETSFAYRKQSYSILNNFFKYLHSKRLVNYNPMEFIERPKKNEIIKLIEKSNLTDANLDLIKNLIENLNN